VCTRTSRSSLYKRFSDEECCNYETLNDVNRNNEQIIVLVYRQDAQVGDSSGRSVLLVGDVSCASQQR